MNRIRRSLTFANVTSALALVIAVGLGTAWAADQIGSREIRNGGVNTADLGGGAVTSKKVANGTLRNADLSESVSTGRFAYVSDPVDGGQATLPYGHGASRVQDLGTGNYIVTFNDDLSKCVAQATPGTGFPRSENDGGAGFSVPEIALLADQVHLAFNSPQGGAGVDTSFLLSVLC
jgi:hypothetical protein